MSRYDPAFPLVDTQSDFCELGMTLRDYFAAKAMQGMLAATEISPSMPTLANSAYAIADAMLEARDQ